MNAEQVQKLLDQLADSVKVYVTRALDPITSRISACETRIAAAATILSGAKPVVDGGFDLLAMHARLARRIEALEARPALSFVGQWQAGSVHVPGDICSYQGSMWHCWNVTSDQPGTTSSWTECVRAGRDGRDARNAA
jgi:hypothetical protein